MKENLLVVIPARGGSKRLPGKNIKILKGDPLIHYTVKAAREVFPDEVITVSTDDEKIKRTVEKTGLHVPFLRPAELATDTAGTRGVILHAIDFAESNGFHPEIVCLLQPTSPYRTAHHIKEALEIYNSDLDMVASVYKTKANPYFVLKEENEEGFLENSKKGNFQRSQDCPTVWELNGAIFLINVNSIKASEVGNFTKVKKYVMDELPSVDIDDQLDWFVAEKVYDFL